MITVVGKHGIQATVLCHSVNEAGKEIITFECEYPRIIHSELLTHGMLARNSASSRAIPAAKMAEQLTARPVRFGKNVSGMQDGGEYNELINGYTPEEWWHLAKLSATQFSQGFAEAGYHKQVFNRLTEAFQMMKTVITATEWPNFFWLRDHEAADPTLHELAHCMNEAKQKSKPQLLRPGEWHLPYVGVERHNNTLEYYIEQDDGTKLYLTPSNAVKVSAARCAAVSYRNTDYGIDKCEQVHARLIGDERKHASALEHCATPIQDVSFYDELNVPTFPSTWEPGVTHVDRDGKLWSGKFQGWVQYRKLIPGENYTGA